MRISTPGPYWRVVRVGGAAHGHGRSATACSHSPIRSVDFDARRIEQAIDLGRESACTFARAHEAWLAAG